tara:strand:+ start:73 stop:309 length:237 start_codon:yes stop_codon:yes gene_type:complete
MAESKQYKDLTPKEKYDSAIEADKAPWNPIQAAKDLIVEKLSPKKEEVKPAKKMAKGGSASKRADGCAIKGKTKGRMI